MRVRLNRQRLLDFLALSRLTAIGLAACWIPARRAAGIDPAITMQSD